MDVYWLILHSELCVLLLQQRGLGYRQDTAWNRNKSACIIPSFNEHINLISSVQVLWTMLKIDKAGRKKIWALGSERDKPVKSHVSCLTWSKGKGNKPFVNITAATLNYVHIYSLHFDSCTCTWKYSGYLKLSPFLFRKWVPQRSNRWINKYRIIQSWLRGPILPCW